MMFAYTKVITRNFIQDFINKIRNLLGADLPSYEHKIDNAIGELYLKLHARDIKWFRLEISEVTNGAVIITIYGEAK